MTDDSGRLDAKRRTHQANGSPLLDEYHRYGLVPYGPRQYIKCSKRCCNGKSKRQEERERQEAEE